MFKANLLATLFTGLLAGLGAQNMLLPQKVRTDANHRASFDSSPIALAKGGHWNAVLVVPDDATPVSKFAGDELARCLSRALGEPIPIVRNFQAGSVNLVVGFHSLSKTFGVDPTSLPRDAFMIQHARLQGVSAILIAGNDDPKASPPLAQKMKSVWDQLYERATLFAAYEFLERFADCRFYFPEEAGSVIPRFSDFSVYPMSVYEAPDSTVRRHSSIFKSMAAMDGKALLPGGEDQSGDRGWLWANRERDYFRHETTYVPTGHGLAHMSLVERFGQSHPEYFSLLANGQRDISLEPNRGHLCLLNQGLEDEIFADIVSYFKGEPPSVRNMVIGTGKIPTWHLGTFRPGYVNLMPQDGFGPSTRCHCTECESFFNTNASYSEYVFRFVARVAKRLKEAQVPCTVATMAYATYLDVPSVSLPDNIIVQIAPMGPWMEKFPQVQAEQDKLIASWSQKLGQPGKVFLWNYINDYGSTIPYGVPSFSPRKIASYYKRNAPQIRGAFLQSSTSYRLYQYLNWSVFYKVMWDRSFDVEAYLAEHHRQMFGAGAGSMAKFYDALESTWDECIGEYRTTEMGPSFRPKTETEVWTHLIHEDRLKAWGLFFNEAESQARGDEASLSRIRYMRENLLGAIAQFRQRFQGSKREIEDLVYPSFMTRETMTIDGELKETCWSEASPQGMGALKKSESPKVSTLVRTSWADGMLYLAVECFEPLMNELLASDRAHDDPGIWKDSGIEIFLNTAGERSRYGHLFVNVRGSFGDSWYENGKSDWTWESGARIAVKSGNDRYTVELAIPMPAGRREMVANVTRTRALKNATQENQLQTLSPFLLTSFLDGDRFGTFRLVDPATAGAAPEKEVNLLVNGSFDELTSSALPKGWSLGSKDSLAGLDSQDFRFGRVSLRVASDSFAQAQSSVQQLQLPLKPNAEYQLSYFVKYEAIESNPESKVGGGFSTVFFGEANHFFPTQRYRGSAPWMKESYSFKTGTNVGENRYLRLGLASSKGTIWFDDVRLRMK